VNSAKCALADQRLYRWRQTLPRAVNDAVAKPRTSEMMKHVHVKVRLPDEDEKQAEAEKTARLRALRLTKEAADKKVAAREIVAVLPRSRKAQPNQPILRIS
jgi:hypothetical protein